MTMTITKRQDAKRAKKIKPTSIHRIRESFLLGALGVLAVKGFYV